MAHIIMENTFTDPLTDEEHSRLARRLDPCLEAHGAKWMRSYLSFDKKRIVCEFEAADAEAVRASYRESGSPFERIWTAELFQR